MLYTFGEMSCFVAFQNEYSKKPRCRVLASRQSASVHQLGRSSPFVGSAR